MRLVQERRRGNVIWNKDQIPDGLRDPGNDGLYLQLTGSHCRVLEAEHGCSGW